MIRKSCVNYVRKRVRKTCAKDGWENDKEELRELCQKEMCEIRLRGIHACSCRFFTPDARFVSDTCGTPHVVITEPYQLIHVDNNIDFLTSDGISLPWSYIHGPFAAIIKCISQNIGNRKRPW